MFDVEKNNKFQLIIIVVIAFITLVVFIATYSYNQVSKNVINSTFSHLSALQQNKIQEVTNWFNNYEKLLISISNNRETKEAFTNFEKSFYNISNEINIPEETITKNLNNIYENDYLAKVNYNLQNISDKKDLNEYLPKDKNALIAQYLYFSSSKDRFNYYSEYQKVHSIYHDSYSQYLNAYNLYDIFMVDLKGNLIYTNFKEKDFGTNLFEGPYKDSGLANAFKKALKINKSEIVFEDFRPYEPSYNTSASFLATPIFIDEKLSGVFIFQTSITHLNKLMNYNYKYKDVGLGKTGESYLIGEDFKLRSDIRSIDKLIDSSIKDLTTSIGIYEINSEITEKISNNDYTNTQIITNNYIGKEVLSVYSKIDLPNELNWYLVTEIETQEALKDTDEFRNNIIVLSFVLFGLIAMTVITYIDKLMNIINRNKKELQEINAKLNSQQTFVKSLMENAPIPIYHKDLNGKYMGVNKEFKKMFGFTSREVIGKTVHDVAPKEVASEYEKKDIELYKNPKIQQSYENILKNKITGEYHDVIFFKKALVDDNGKVLGLIGAILDITEKKKNDLKLLEYAEKLKEINSNLEEKVKIEVEKSMKTELQLFESAKLAAMGSMIGNIIHQWKQPLSIISLKASGLNYQADYFDSIDSETIKEETLVIMETIDRLSTITETFRNYLKEKKEFKEIILEDKVNDSLIITGSILKDKGVELRKLFDANSSTKIKTIPTELTEVIINIVNNAIDAIVENKIIGGFLKVDIQKKANDIIISIEDNAGGINEEIIPYIFEEYFSTKSSDKGTGLGLYMSKKIVTESLHGDLSVENTSNGAKFNIKLPLRV